MVSSALSKRRVRVLPGTRGDIVAKIGKEYAKEFAPVRPAEQANLAELCAGENVLPSFAVKPGEAGSRALPSALPSDRGNILPGGEYTRDADHIRGVILITADI